MSKISKLIDEALLQEVKVDRTTAYNLSKYVLDAGSSFSEILVALADESMFQINQVSGLKPEDTLDPEETKMLQKMLPMFKDDMIKMAKKYIDIPAELPGLTV